MFILFWGHRESGTRFEFFFSPHFCHEDLPYLNKLRIPNIEVI